MWHLAKRQLLLPWTGLLCVSQEHCCSWLNPLWQGLQVPVFLSSPTLLSLIKCIFKRMRLDIWCDVM